VGWGKVKGMEIGYFQKMAIIKSATRVLTQLLQVARQPKERKV
jgi:hypothetical protein